MLQTALTSFKSNRRKNLILKITLVLSLILNPLTSMMLGYAAVTPRLTEWTVPTPNSGVWGLTLDPSGNCCWFLEYFGNKVGHLDPASNTFQEWMIPTQQANPYGLATTTIAGSLTLWGTESAANKAFAFSPSSGLFREYNISTYGGGGLGVGFISVEPPSRQVRVWFTETLNNANGEFVYDQNTGNVTLYEDTFPAQVGGGAYGVYATSTSVWFAGFSALVRWDRSSQQYTMWPLPSHGSVAGRFITLDQYGQAWYTQGAADATRDENFVGVLRRNSTFQEWHIPSLGSDPRGISLNPITQQPWVAEQSPIVGNGTVAALDTYGGTFIPSLPATAPSGAKLTILAPSRSQAKVVTSTVTPSTNTTSISRNGPFTEYGLGPTQPREAIADGSGDIWISEPGTNKIARLSPGPDFALKLSPPTISIPQGSSEIVTVTGISISSYTGQMSLAVTSTPSRGVTLSNFTLNPLNIPAGGTVSARFTISVAPDYYGTSSIMIQGTSGAIVHGISFIFTITNSSSRTSNPSRCLIATATYGSESSPEVQFLRNFRDNSLEKTKTGSGFLIMFNSWYYSFSPHVANYLNNHDSERTVMKGALYPLITFLLLSSSLYTYLAEYPELATLISGLLASSLIGAFYIGLPLGVFTRRLRLTRMLKMKTPVVLLLAGIGTTIVGQLLASISMLMISSSITVLAAVSASATLTSVIISRMRNSARPEKHNSLTRFMKDP